MMNYEIKEIKEYLKNDLIDKVLAILMKEKLKRGFLMLNIPENYDTEFKESWKDEYIKWICGFANAKGGKIYIGVDDKSKIIGIKNAKKLMEDIPNKVRDILGIIVDVALHEKGKKKIS